jgi:PAS domain S-box-containing protein
VGETIGGVLERQRADLELRRSEDRFRTLFQNLSDVVMVVDLHGRLSFETPSLQRLLGLHPGGFEETRVEDLVAPADLPRLRQLLAQVRAGAPRPPCELGWRGEDGTLVPCEVLVASLPDGDGGTTMLTLRDLRGRPAPETEGAPGSRRVAARPLVLFVDDDSTVRLLAQTVLQRAGYRVLLAADGPPALEIFARRSSEIDLVVLDLTMPRMTGAEVLRALRAVRPDLPVVVSTGYHPSEALEQLEALEPGHLLQKPYDSMRLLMAVGEALGASAR